MEWGDIMVGTQERIEHLITTSDMVDFGELTGDCNPIHYDCSDPVVYGMLTTSFVSALVGNHLPGNGAVIASTSFDYLSPVHVGDILSVFGIVRRKSEARRTLLLDIQIRNQNNVDVVDGTVMVIAK